MARHKPIDFKTAEARLHDYDGDYPEFGRSYRYITCPFCGKTVKAYLWSLAGGGKRCQCGAMHTSFGRSYKARDGAAGG